jgi:hypothetical protein
LPADISFEALVDRTKLPPPPQGLGWRIERDYQELKQELGLGHYEGRGWRGPHHHITLCIAAYGILIAERAIPLPKSPENTPDPRRLAVPPVTDPKAPPLRPERHISNTISAPNGGLLSLWLNIFRATLAAARKK